MRSLRSCSLHSDSARRLFHHLPHLNLNSNYLLLKLLAAGTAADVAQETLEQERALRLMLTPSAHARLVEFRKMPALVWNPTAWPAQRGDQYLLVFKPDFSPMGSDLSSPSLRLETTKTPSESA